MLREWWQRAMLSLLETLETKSFMLRRMSLIFNEIWSMHAQIQPLNHCPLWALHPEWREPRLPEILGRITSFPSGWLQQRTVLSLALASLKAVWLWENFCSSYISTLLRFSISRSLFSFLDWKVFRSFYLLWWSSDVFFFKYARMFSCDRSSEAETLFLECFLEERWVYFSFDIF